MKLAHFFDAVTPFLLGERDAGDFEAACGSSPSGRSRLEVYPRFVYGNKLGVMGKLYPLVRAQVGDEEWTRLIREYVSEHVSQHWEINRVGARFPEWLAARCGAAGALPSHLPDLAAYEWLEFLTYTHAAEDRPVFDGDGVPAVNPTADARELAYDIAAWVNEEGPTRAEAPSARNNVLIAYRDPRTFAVRMLMGTPVVLYLLKGLTEGREQTAIAAEMAMDRTAVDTLVWELAKKGLLVSGAGVRPPRQRKED